MGVRTITPQKFCKLDAALFRAAVYGEIRQQRLCFLVANGDLPSGSVGKPKASKQLELELTQDLYLLFPEFG